MGTLNASFFRDENRVPLTYYGLISQTSKAITGSNNTFNVPIFTVTGAIEVTALWGVITTDLGVNHTASAFRINDQTAQVYLTAVGGIDISTKKAGSVIFKKGLVAAAVSLMDNAAGAILEGTALETEVPTPVMIVKKTGALTNIEYHYATTDTPTSGAIQFFVRWLPFSADANVTPL